MYKIKRNTEEAQSVKNGNLHVLSFISEAEEKYNTRIVSNKHIVGANRILKMSVIFIVYKFNNISERKLSILFRCSPKNVSFMKWEGIRANEKNSAQFMKYYNELLPLYIECSRKFIHPAAATFEKRRHHHNDKLK